MIGWPNRIEDATLSGGSWSSGLPLNNLKNRELAAVARSTNATTGSTAINLDLGQARTLRVVALVNHNLSQAAQFRVKLGTTSGGSDLFSGGYEPAWALTFDGQLLEWENDNWWMGAADNEFIRHPFMAVYLLPDWLSARYVRIEISDTGNADGYVQLGRVFVGSGSIPEYNASYGMQDDWEDLSEVDYNAEGEDTVVYRRSRRIVRFSLDHIGHLGGNASEFATWYEMRRRMGGSREVLYIPNIADPIATQRTGFLGLMQKQSAITYPNYNTRSLGFEITERL